MIVYDEHFFVRKGLGLLSKHTNEKELFTIMDWLQEVEGIHFIVNIKLEAVIADSINFATIDLWVVYCNNYHLNSFLVSFEICYF